MASKSMNINTSLAITFSTCNHGFLRVSRRRVQNTVHTQEASEPDCATDPNKRVTGSWQNRTFGRKHRRQLPNDAALVGNRTRRVSLPLRRNASHD